MSQAEAVEWVGGVRSWIVPSTVATLSIYQASRSDLAALYALALVFILITVTFTSVHVRIGQDDVVYGFGAWMWPKRTIGLAEIRRVEVSMIEPLKYGSWGLRGSRHAIARRGPGIILHLGGSTTAITVDRPQEAAAQIHRHRSGREPA